MGEKIIEISTHAASFIVKTNKRRFIGWGNNYFGNSGSVTGTSSPFMTSTSTYTLTVITIPGKSIAQIARNVLDFHYILSTNGCRSTYTDGTITSTSCLSPMTLFGFRLNTWYQLGDTTTTQRNLLTAINVPAALSGKSIIDVGVGSDFAMVLTTSGQVFGWGAGNRVGDGSSTGKGTPALVGATVASLLYQKFVLAISCGTLHTLALTNNNGLYAWGGNTYGQLGDLTVTTAIYPVVVQKMSMGAARIATISAGSQHNLVLTEDNKVYAWGYNAFGCVGDGTTNSPTYKNYVVPVNTDGVLNGKNITRIAAGGYISMAQDFNGVWYSWGVLLNWGTSTAAYTPYILPAVFSTSFLPAGNYITEISMSNANIMMLTNTGLLFGNGDYSNSILNSLTSGFSTTFARVDPKFTMSAGETIISVAQGYSSTMARISLGRSLIWGINTAGQLGINSATTTTVLAAPTAIYGTSANDITFIFPSPYGTFGFIGRLGCNYTVISATYKYAQPAYCNNSYDVLNYTIARRMNESYCTDVDPSVTFDTDTYGGAVGYFMKKPSATPTPTPTPTPTTTVAPTTMKVPQLVQHRQLLKL